MNWKDAIFANFKVLFRHLHGRTEENHKNESDSTVSRPRLQSSGYKSEVVHKEYWGRDFPVRNNLLNNALSGDALCLSSPAKCPILRNSECFHWSANYRWGIGLPLTITLWYKACSQTPVQCWKMNNSEEASCLFLRKTVSLLNWFITTPVSLLFGNYLVSDTLLKHIGFYKAAPRRSVLLLCFCLDLILCKVFLLRRLNITVRYFILLVGQGK